MLLLSRAFYQGGIYLTLPSFRGEQRTIPKDTLQDPIPVPDVVLTDYQKAVIGYYDRFGYIPNQADRKWLEGYLGDYQVRASEDGEYSLVARTQERYANRYEEPGDIGKHPYHWDFGGGYTDETLPQAHGEDWYRKY